VVGDDLFLDLFRLLGGIRSEGRRVVVGNMCQRPKSHPLVACSMYVCLKDFMCLTGSTVSVNCYLKLLLGLLLGLATWLSRL
jgi:hypothetical protein